MKRMFDKEEIVEIAKEEGGSVTVDSELSPTSENPVQNKVIYEALNGKKLYQHNITLVVSSNAQEGYMSIISSKNTEYTASEVAKILYDNGFTNGTTKAYKLRPLFELGTNIQNQTLLISYKLTKAWSSNGTTLNAYLAVKNFTHTIVDGTISITSENGSLTGDKNITSIIDNIIEI